MHGTRVNAEHLASWPRLYSEHHLRVFHADLDNEADPSVAELDQLNALAQNLSSSLGITVALSFNRKPHQSVDVEPGKKRFLNVRFRNFSSRHPALEWVALFYQRLAEAAPAWKKGNAIDEWVVFDSFSGMDKGWIDPKRNVLVVCSSPALEAQIREHAKRVGISVAGASGFDDAFVGLHLVPSQESVQQDQFRALPVVVCDAPQESVNQVFERIAQQMKSS